MSAQQGAPIDVLFVMSDLAGGGAERSLLELLSRLDRERVRPRLFLLHHAGIHLPRVPSDVPLAWGCEGGSRLRYHLPGLVSKAVAHGARSDVIVGSMETSSSYVAWLAAVSLGKPLVGWVRTELDEYLNLVPGWHRRLARWLYPRCAGVVVPSTGSASSLQRVAPVAEARLHVIHNAVDREEVREMAAEPLPAATDGLQARLQAKPFIVAAGRLSIAQKGFDLLVRAHARVRGQGTDHNLLILGEGPDRNSLERLAASLHVSDSLLMPGFQLNPFPFFKGAAVLAAPARVDGFGRVFLEAMALGLPVIGSEASGPAEILDGNRYGMAIPCEDVDRLSSALHCLLTDAPKRTRYSHLSLDRVRAYEPGLVAQQWEILLRGSLEAQ